MPKPVVRVPRPGDVKRRRQEAARKGEPLNAPPAAGPAAPIYMRVARVARALDVSKKRVYQLILERRLKVIRLGPRQIRVLQTSLHKLLIELHREEELRDY